MPTLVRRTTIEEIFSKTNTELSCPLGAGEQRFEDTDDPLSGADGDLASDLDGVEDGDE